MRWLREDWLVDAPTHMCFAGTRTGTEGGRSESVATVPLVGAAWDGSISAAPYMAAWLAVPHRGRQVLFKAIPRGRRRGGERAGQLKRRGRRAERSGLQN